MVNINNLCSFEGRIVNDLQAKQGGNGQNTYTKVSFRIAVAKNLTSEQRQQKQNGQQIQDSDFIPMYATGKTADFILKFFSKGKPIKIVASYNSYTTQDQNGNNVYGHIFKVEEVGFTISSRSNDNYNSYNNNNNNNNNYGNNNNYNNNNYNNNNYGNNGNNNMDLSDIYPVDDGDMPF